ncbi:hypothetical protein GGR79_001600 [Xanthomonas arboricola]|nr:hypothetical protein [Xanthomonas arboricola]
MLDRRAAQLHRAVAAELTTLTQRAVRLQIDRACRTHHGIADELTAGGDHQPTGDGLQGAGECGVAAAAKIHATGVDDARDLRIRCGVQTQGSACHGVAAERQTTAAAQQRLPTLAADIATTVQLRRVDGQRIACNERAAIDQTTGNRRLPIACGRQTARRGDRRCLETQIAAGVAATGIVQRTCTAQLQIATRRHCTALCDVDTRRIEGHCIRCNQLTLQFQPTAGLHISTLPGLRQSTQAHVAAAVHAQGGGRVQGAQCINRVRIQPDRAAALQRAGQANLGRAQVCSGCRIGHTVAAQHAIGAQIQRTRRMQTAIGIQFRTEQTDGAGAAAAAVAQGAAGLCIQDTGGDQIACQGHARAAQTHIALLRAEHAALVEVTGGTHIHSIARHRGPAQAHLARAVDLQIATLRRQGAATHHADTGFGRNQANTVCIHAAQLRHVDADRRCGAIGARHHVQQHAVVADPPCTCGGDQFPGPDRALHAELTRQQVQAIHVRRIQTVAADTQRTAGDAEAVQRTIAAQVGRAGGQGHARGVEKPAAIAGNAVGVGDHQLRLGAGDFGVPLQAAAG